MLLFQNQPHKFHAQSSRSVRCQNLENLSLSLIYLRTKQPRARAAQKTHQKPASKRREKLIMRCDKLIRPKVQNSSSFGFGYGVE